MTTRIGISGMGRVGRQVLRRAAQDSDIEIVGINDLAGLRTTAALLRFDSVHGLFPGLVETERKNLLVSAHGGIQQHIPFFEEREPHNLPWGELGADVVVESTGVFTRRQDLEQHREAGAKKVILSAPTTPLDVDITIVLGVNEKKYRPSKHHLISNASCTTNGLAPPVAVLHKRYGIIRGDMTTVHAITNDQRPVDVAHSDLRRARSLLVNTIPTETGAAKALKLVIPDMEGKLDGFSVRVPVLDGSMIILTAVLEQEITTGELLTTLKRAASRARYQSLEYSEDPLVSQMIIGNPHSSIIDAEFTKANGNLARVVAWYDNEWGYACRVVDLCKFVTETA